MEAKGFTTERMAEVYGSFVERFGNRGSFLGTFHYEE